MAKTPPKAPAFIAAGVLLAAPISASFEGLRTHPNPDPASPKLEEVCYGDTEVPMRVYTPADCKAMLVARQQRDYAPAVLKCVPGFADARRVHAFAASIDFAYNAGVKAFCKSRMARAFNAGNWKAGCEGFRGYYVTANGKAFRGLVMRREAERATCLESVR